MNHSQKERRAVYETAIIFNSFNWTFREQSIGDIGIDAFIESPIDQDKRVHLFAAQIKGGERNFYRKSTALSFYFNQRHFDYWKAMSEICPVLIILQDAENVVYWQHFSDKYIRKTPQGWRIDLPLTNLLKNAKEELLQLSKPKLKSHGPNVSARLVNIPKFDSHVFIDSKSKKLKINFTTESDFYTLNLNYRPDPKYWDNDKSFLDWEDPYYFTLGELIYWVRKKCEIEKDQNISQLLYEIEVLVETGMEPLMEYFFNITNTPLGVPKYADFIQIFTKFSGLKRNEFIAQALDSTVCFRTNDSTYIVDTYPGLQATLKSYLEKKSYDEIYTETERSIWSEIYLDPGIEKYIFVPILQRKWEFYWEELYSEIKSEIGTTTHLDTLRSRSLRELNNFINLYNDTTDIIKLAFDFDEMVLYPLAVATMLEIYDLDTCLSEYCEYEFFLSNEWEDISIDDDCWDCEVFFIKEKEY